MKLPSWMNRANIVIFIVLCLCGWIFAEWTADDIEAKNGWETSECFRIGRDCSVTDEIICNKCNHLFPKELIHEQEVEIVKVNCF